MKEVQRQVKGPQGLPLIGHVLDFAKGPPDYLLSLAREYGDIVPFRIGPEQFYLISHPDHVQEVLVKQSSKFEKAERDRFVMGKVIGKGLVTNIGGAFHKRQRMLSQPAFRKKRIPLYGEAMVEETENFLARWEDGQEFDIAEQMMLLTMFIVSRTLFDVEVGEEAEQIGEATEMLQKLAQREFRLPFLLPQWLPVPHNFKQKKAKRYVDGLIMDMIRERRAEEAEGRAQDRGDLFSKLLSAEDESGQRMDDQQLLDELLTLFVAGHETTSNALTWTWMLLSQNPEVEARFRQEIDEVLADEPLTTEHFAKLPYTQMVFKEAMRLYPPAWTLNVRTALEDAEIDGFVIPKGCNVFVVPYVIHRDPRYYEEPMRFDPERWLPEKEKELHRYAYLPFGAGPRVCIGNAFAMMEGTLLLAGIARSFDIEVLPGQDFTPNAALTMSPKHGVKVRIKARTTATKSDKPTHTAAQSTQPTQDTPEAEAPHTAALTQCPFHAT